MDALLHSSLQVRQLRLLREISLDETGDRVRRGKRLSGSTDVSLLRTALASCLCGTYRDHRIGSRGSGEHARVRYIQSAVIPDLSSWINYGCREVLAHAACTHLIVGKYITRCKPKLSWYTDSPDDLNSVPWNPQRSRPPLPLSATLRSAHRRCPVEPLPWGRQMVLLQPGPY